MDRSLQLTLTEHHALVEQYRKGNDPRVRLRVHIVLLLTHGYSWAIIAGVLFCSTRTIARWQTRVRQEGIMAVLGPQPTPQPRLGSWWSGVVAS